MTGFNSIPAFLESSFSGINPMDNSTVSQGMISSVPGIGFKFSSTAETSTACTRLEPTIFVTVVLKCSGIPKSSRQFLMLR